PCSPARVRRTRTRDRSWLGVSRFLLLELVFFRGDDRRDHRLRLLPRCLDAHVPQHTFVELHRTLVFGQQIARRLKLGDDVVAGVFLLDLIRHRALAPMGHVRQRAFAVLGQEEVKAIEFFGHCRLVQGTIKNVDRLVPTIHATSLWSWVTRCGGRHRVGDMFCAAKDRHEEASRARMWYCRGTTVIALPLVTATIVALAQQVPGDTTGRINGWAISSFNGHPIAGVMISAPEAHKFVVTDSTGRFALAGLPTGRHAIRVSYEGRDTEDYPFELQDQETKQIAVVLDVDATDLDPIVVEARQPNLWRDLAGFYERRRTYSGFAHFFTREDISRARLAKLSGLLTLEGIVNRCSRYQECFPTRFTRGRLCAVPISGDGVAQRAVV